MPQAIHSSYITPSTTNKNLVRSKPKKALKPKANNLTFKISILFSVLLVGCFVFYLYLTIQMVEMNFSLRAKEEELAILQEENKEIEDQMRQFFSLGEMQEKAKELSLVKADNVRYLQFSQGGTLSQVVSKEKNY